MMELKEKLFSDEIKRLTPILGRETAERLSKAYLIGDEVTRKRIIEMLDIMKAAVLADPQLRDASLLEPPATGKGEIEVGDVIYGNKPVGRLALSKDIFMTHVGVFGSSGYGKTNISYLLVKQLSDNGVPVVVFDFSKKNYRDLMQTELRDRISVYTLGSGTAPFSFNPLIPPHGISRTQWAKEFAEVFDHAYWLLGGGRHIILKALSRLYDENDAPVLNDLKRTIEDMQSSTPRERNWVSTALRPLESLCMKETGDIFAEAEGILPSSFFQDGAVTVLEMDALSTNDKTFFIEIIMQWIRDWLVAQGKREQLQGVVILEEAHHILNREKSKKIGSETVMDLVFREMRELGLGIVYLDQHPSMVSYPALGNTSTHVYLSLGLDTRYSSDVQDAANMLGLEEEESNYIRTLPAGHAFVLMRSSAWRKPFNVRFDNFTITKGLIADSDVAHFMKNRIPDRMIKKIPAEKMDDMQLRIIEAIGSGRGVFTSQLYKSLKVSGSLFKEQIEALARKGVVGVREVRVEKTKANYYYLTNAGEKLLEQNYPGIAKSDKVSRTNEIRSLFDALGWEYSSDAFSGIETMIKSGGNVMPLVMLAKLNRKEIQASVKSGCHYICSSPEIRNTLLQHAAKLARSTGAMKISAATIDEMQKTGFVDYAF